MIEGSNAFQVVSITDEMRVIIDEKRVLKIGCGLLVITATIVGLSILFPPSAIFLYPIAILFGIVGLPMTISSARALSRLDAKPSIPYPLAYEFHKSNPLKTKQRLTSQMKSCKEQMEEGIKNEKTFQYTITKDPLKWKDHNKQEEVGSYEVGIASWKGAKETNEDEYLATSFELTIAGNKCPVQLFGVFDGHRGGEASKYVKDNLKDKLEKALNKLEGLSDEGICGL